MSILLSIWHFCVRYAGHSFLYYDYDSRLVHHLQVIAVIVVIGVISVIAATSLFAN
jgi:hypothetical protein